MWKFFHLFPSFMRLPKLCRNLNQSWYFPIRVRLSLFWLAETLASHHVTSCVSELGAWWYFTYLIRCMMCADRFHTKSDLTPFTHFWLWITISGFSEWLTAAQKSSYYELYSTITQSFFFLFFPIQCNAILKSS